MTNGIRNAGEVNSDHLYLSIAGLEIEIDASQIGLKLAAPHSYCKFSISSNGRGFNGDGQGRELKPVIENKMFLQVSLQEHFIGELQGQALFKNINWEIWLNNERRYVFIAPRLLPPRSITVDTHFMSGVITGRFDPGSDFGILPIEGLDMYLFANWLANYGDFILHSAGIDSDGKGYCFAGMSGSGKSTLAKGLYERYGLQLLGEDQVILRWMDDRFWIFGTPWHENPDMCSSKGVPLSKIFFLERAGNQRTLTLSPLDGTARLLQNAFIPFYRTDVMPGILDRLSRLAELVPFYSLDYRIGTDVWQLIESAGS